MKTEGLDGFGFLAGTHKEVEFSDTLIELMSFRPLKLCSFQNFLGYKPQASERTDSVLLSLFEQLADCFENLQQQPLTMRQSLGDLHEQFMEYQHPGGIYLTWAWLVDTYFYTWPATEGLKATMEKLGQIEKLYPACPSVEIAMHVQVGVFGGNFLLQTSEQGLVEQVNTVEFLLQESNSPDFIERARCYLRLYYISRGDFDLAMRVSCKNLGASEITQ